MNFLPAVIIGGPPHAGKSVLFYALTKELSRRNVSHHAIRACPDGEGNWSQEASAETVREIRIKGEFTSEFTVRICRDIEHRLLPMLVDVGGKPQGEQEDIFRRCTHSILLLKPEDAQNCAFWQALVERCGLIPLAQLFSQQQGTSFVKAKLPVIEGTLVGLERHHPVQGELLELLVERIAALFSSYQPDELERGYCDNAPSEMLHLPQILHYLEPDAQEWAPAMLPRLLVSLSPQTSLSVYGRGPHWLYAALAAFTAPAPFYQFDPRLGESNGWIKPPALQFGTVHEPDIVPSLHLHDNVQVLHVKLTVKHIDYLQADGLMFPRPVPYVGLIIDGQMPSWLVTALVRLYLTQDIPWIACHYPQLQAAVVVSAHDGTYQPGTLIPMP